MIPVLLADDDLLALDRLRGLIDWEAHGFKIIGTAVSGELALKLALALKPRIAILDVDMPKMNGVEVAQALSQQEHVPLMLMLSNYDSYAYVRAAMRHGAVDYLLKHQLTGPQLLLKLSEMRHKLDQDALSASRLTYFSAVAKRQYLREAALGHEGTQHSLMATQAAFAAPLLVPAALRAQGLSPSDSRQLTAADNLCQSVLSTLGQGLAAHVEQGDFALLFSFGAQEDPGRVERITGAAAQMLCSNLGKVLGLAAQCRVGQPIAAMGDYAGAYAHLTASFQLGDQQSPRQVRSEHIQKAIHMIRNHYAEDLSLELTAERLKLSPEHLSRLFKKEVGVSFIDFLNDHRIEVARHLISSGRVSPGEVYPQVGFRSYNYFLHVFKKKTGTTPTQWSGKA